MIRTRPAANGSAPDRPAAGGSDVIVVKNVVKTYELGDIAVHALQGVSLTIQRGDFVAIMGASGSGKSTLMNILGCLDLPTSGRYLLDAVDVRGMSEDELADVRSALGVGPDEADRGEFLQRVAQGGTGDLKFGGEVPFRQ